MLNFSPSHKNLFNKFFLVCIFLVGIFFSLKTGISHDEYHEQLNWEKNYQVIKSIGSTSFKQEYESLKSYRDKYYGIGFHLVSQPFQFLFSKFLTFFFNIENDGAFYISKHPIIFISFFISAFFFRRILKLAIEDKTFLDLTFIFYCFYPYLLGHSLINPKDIPFLTIWLILTFYSFVFIKDLLINELFNRKYFSYIVIFFPFLLSIRLSGVLFVFQFFTMFFVTIESSNKKFLRVLIKNYKFLLKGILIVFLILYTLLPISWLNFFEIFNGIMEMSKYPHGVSTLTNGEYVKASNIPIDYIFTWLIVKLPTFTIVGLFLFFFNNKEFEKNINAKLIVHAFLITFLVIYFLLYFRSASLYDEIRHILFLVPLLLISGLICFNFFHKKFSYFFLILTIFIFIFEAFKIQPYQYTWFNMVSRFYEVNKNYEIDYWATANRELSVFVGRKNQLRENTPQCVYGSQYDYVFLKKKGFSCFKDFTKLNDDNSKKIILQYGRNLRNKYKVSNSCSLIYDLNYQLLFSKHNFELGKVFVCN
jgi:hypothetical protein